VQFPWQQNNFGLHYYTRVRNVDHVKKRLIEKKIRIKYGQLLNDALRFIVQTVEWYDETVGQLVVRKMLVDKWQC